jgi:hypothetical protein
MTHKKPYSKSNILHENHWVKESFTQRITAKNWKLLLLNNDDNIIFEGLVRCLKAKRLGYGVVEVSKVKKGGILK